MAIIANIGAPAACKDIVSGLQIQAFARRSSPVERPYNSPSSDSQATRGVYIPYRRARFNRTLGLVGAVFGRT